MLKIKTKTRKLGASIFYHSSTVVIVLLGIFIGVVKPYTELSDEGIINPDKDSRSMQMTIGIDSQTESYETITKDTKAKKLFFGSKKLKSSKKQLVSSIFKNSGAEVSSGSAMNMASSEVLPAGTLIIPLNKALQGNSNNRSRRAYGLAVNLLHNDIPLKWIIDESKTNKTDVDFSASAREVYPNVSNYENRDFITGAFAIFPGLEASAATVIEDFNDSGTDVYVYELEFDTPVEVYSNIVHKPFVFVEVLENPGIHTSILSAAGLTNGVHYTTGNLNTITPDDCVTMITVPHNDAISSTNRVNVRSFLQSGGNFFAQCAAIRGFQEPITNRLFPSSTYVDNPGLNSILYDNPQEPSAQFEGGINAESVGGSVKTFGLVPEPTDGTRIVHDNVDFSAYTGIVDGAAGATGGYIHFLGGHDYDGDIDADRMYLNAMMRPSSRPQECGLFIGPEAFDDQATLLNCGEPVIFDVTANDDNPVSGTPIITLLTSGDYGTFSVSGTNIEYIPTVENWPGLDSVTYQICDINNYCDQATFTIFGDSDLNVSGTVFEDSNENGVLDGGENGTSGITVNLYEDVNSSGTVDGGDTFIEAENTDATGDYDFIITDAASTPLNTSITTTKASFGYQGGSNTNYGSQNFLGLFNYNNFNGHPYIEFDLSALDPNCPVSSANLILTRNSSSGGGSDFEFQVRRLTTYWEESTVTWSSPWSAVGGDYTSTIYATAIGGSSDPEGTTYSLDISSLVQEWLNGTPNYGLVVLPPQNSDFNWFYLYSDDASGVNDRPHLEVNQLCFSSTDYVLEVDVSTLPANYIFTTDNEETASFTSLGQLDCENLFGYIYCPSQPNITVTAGPQNVCEGDDATLTAITNGGSGTCTIQWQQSPDGTSGWTNVGTNSTTYSPLTSTTGTLYYRAIFSCNNGACNNATSNISQVIVNPLPVSGINAVSTICEDISTPLSAVDAGAGATYIWNFGVNATPSTANGPGPHDVVYNNDHISGNNINNTIQLDVNLGGCSEQYQSTITVQANPDVTVSNSPPSCGVDDGTITFTFPDNTSRTNIEFSLDGGATYPYYYSDAIGSATIQDLSSGTYDLFVRWGNNDCPVDLPNVIFDDNTQPIANAGSNQAICNGESITLNAIGGGSYEWSNGAGSTSTVVVTPTSTTTYTVTVTAANLCTDTDNVTVTVNPIPTASIAKDGDVQCDNLMVELSASPPGLSYLWSTTETTETISVTSGGTYQVTITDGNGCTNSSQILVDENIDPTPVLCERYRVRVNGVWGVWTDFNGTCEIVICEDDGLSDIMIDGGPDINTSWVWTDEDGNIDSEVDEIVQFNNIDLSDAGIYTGEYTNPYGCTTTVSVDVIVNANPIVTVNNDGPITCVLPNATLTASPSGMSYLWESGSTGQTEVVSAAGIYSVTVTDGNGCTTVSSSTVSEDLTAPTANAGSDESICIGDLVTLTATGGVSYAWSNGAGNTSSVTLTPLSTTMYTVTVTGSNGCTDTDNVLVTVNPLPIVSIDEDGPVTCSHPNVTLTANPVGMTYLWDNGDTNRDRIVNTAGTYIVTVYDANDCSDQTSITVLEDLTNPVADAGGDQTSCSGEAVTLSATGGGSYEWSNGAGSTAEVIVTPEETTTYTVTVTATNGCTDLDQVTINVDSLPIVEITGSDTICVLTTTSLSPSSGGIWQSSDTSIAVVSSSGTVTGISPGLVNFTFTNSSTGCVSDATLDILVVEDISANIEYIGGLCLNTNTQLYANTSGGTTGLSYSWSGPNGYTATTDTINVFQSGNYYVTVTDAAGCSDDATAFVYESFDPFIFTLDTEICEGEDVTLSVNSSSAVSYQWGPNAGNSTSQSVTVTPGVPSEDYYVTVTNDIGCTAEAFVSIDVIESATVVVSGPDTICVGEVTNLLPNTGGTWTSTNNAVAVVTDDGTVTGISGGTASFVFLDSSTGCESDPTTAITVLDLTTVSISGPSPICEGETTSLSPSTGGTWSSDDPSIATVTTDGIVTAIAEGTVNFVFTDSITGCTSNPSTDLVVNPILDTYFTGPDSICEGELTYLFPTSGGSWVSSDESIATVSAIGVVTSLMPGTVTFTFTSDFSCVSGATAPLTIIEIDEVTISGNPEVCAGESFTLSASSPGGTWSSSDTNIATVSAAGEVTGIAEGTVTITYNSNPNNCETNPEHEVTVIDLPIVNVDGPSEICIGELSYVSTDGSGGFWSSSDESIAFVSVDGTVIGVSAGTATFTYTSSTSCTSDESLTITVSPLLEVDLEIIGSICLEDTTQVTALISGGTPDFTYSWSGPGGFTSTEDTIDVTVSGLYNILVVDDAGCSSNATAFIYESFDPFVVALDTEVCEGEDVELTVNGAGTATFEWSANAGSSTSQTVTVTPSVPGETYYVTITNAEGCTFVGDVEIEVEALPNILLTGLDSICVGLTTTFTPTTGGIWTSSDYSIANITNGGVVTGISPGSVTFTFRDTSTGCFSNPSVPITILPKEDVELLGITDFCTSDSPQVITASVADGSWSVDNPAVATVDAVGLVTPIAPGMTNLWYTPVTGSCYNIASRMITVEDDPIVSINGPSTICQGEITFLFPSFGGSWISNDSTVATVSNDGTVTGISGGSTTFTFTSAFGCSSELSTPITVIPSPEVSFTGPDNICVNETTSVSPSTGGVWISSNNNIATVNSSGIVTGVNAGEVTLTFIEFVNGCIVEDPLVLTVNGAPTIGNPNDSELCIGEITSLSPFTGGFWTSSNPGVAQISNQGVITAIAPGSATFTFTDATTGCDSEASSPVIVNEDPFITLIGPDEICIGEEASLIPGAGGIWISTNPGIATVTNAGVITGVSPGQVQFIFTSNSTGCTSDTSESVVVNDPTPIEITGDDRICQGETTTMSPTTGGSWESSNEDVAVITNSGVVTAINPGTVSFTFISNDFCNSIPSAEIIVDPLPFITYLGDTDLCIGESSSILPNSGGVWASSNESVATITDGGLITAVGPGIADFTFTDTISGCISATETSLNVYEDPVISISGDDEICIGEITNMLPSSGGMWFSSNPSVAHITSSGQVTALGEGQATFTFIDNSTGCQSSDSEPITVLPKPVVTIDGPAIICEGDFTSLLPNTGGMWTSTNTSVATVTNDGVVTAISAGVAKFIFTSNEGCSSNETSPVIVQGKPMIINPEDMLCLGETLQLLPISGGSWESTDTSIAVISSSGLISTVNPGVVTFIFTDSNTGCISEESNPITINPDPTITIVGSDSICIGGTANMTPSTGGVWTSLNPSVATITNTGIVTGLTPGTATFVFEELASGCSSSESEPIVVLSETEVTYLGDSILCVGEYSSIAPSSGGIWTSTNPAVATITNDGVIEAIGQGITNFFFTNSSTGCVSEFSGTMTVNGAPTVSINGSSTLCIGSTSSLSPSSGGVWTALNPSIASVSENGLVTALSEGIAFFVFQDSSTGCVSDSSLSVMVEEPVDVNITGDSIICIGFTTSLSPSTGGIWISHNPDIATVTSSGIVTGMAPGRVAFEFIDVSAGCSIGSITDEITVNSCLAPDFNVALVDQEIAGDLSTNDNISGFPFYNGNLTLISKPTGSFPLLTIQSDGSYTFSASTEGKYLYEVSVCLTPLTLGCSSSLLEVNVVDNVYSTANPISNLEIASTFTGIDTNSIGEEISIFPLINDNCMYTGGCALDSTSVSIITQPTNGEALVELDGTIKYTSDPGFIGIDTIEYQVCIIDGSKCSSSLQLVTVNDLSTVNSTSASDDFGYTLAEQELSGNVMQNDNDAQGDNLVVIAQGSESSPIDVAEGSYYIDDLGNFSFLPEEGFTGHTEIVYTLCDDNADISCTDATLHIQVLEFLSLNLRVYLEGALMQNGGETSITSGLPLMRDDLRVSPFTGANYIPLSDPYTFVKDPFINTPAKFNRIGPGLEDENLTIEDSIGVFGVQGDNAIVDWIHVELRSKDDMTLPIATRSALLQRDGDVVDLDGESELKFQGVNVDSFYVVVKHRSHLGVMSMKVSNSDLVDFTDPNFPVYDYGASLESGIDYTGLAQKSTVVNGYNALWAGDFDSNGKVKFTNPEDDQNVMFINVLFSSPSFLINYDNAYGYLTGDYNMDSKTKYTNPDDDLNYLFSQILLYPQNSQFFSNFNGLIEQVPNDD